MARRFEAGESGYQDDLKWWELIEEAEAAVVGAGVSEVDNPSETLGDDEDNGDDHPGGETADAEHGGRIGRRSGPVPVPLGPALRFRR